MTGIFLQWLGKITHMRVILLRISVCVIICLLYVYICVLFFMHLFVIFLCIVCFIICILYVYICVFFCASVCNITMYICVCHHLYMCISVYYFCASMLNITMCICVSACIGSVLETCVWPGNWNSNKRNKSQGRFL